MKAKEYVALYLEVIQNSSKKDSVTLLLQKMNKETKELIETRRIKSDSGATSLIKEQNNKWNAIVNKLEKLGNCDLPLDTYTKYIDTFVNLAKRIY